MTLGESIERLQAMPAFVQSAVDGAERDELLYRPSPGEFSLVEQACHLRDLEREGYLLRVRRMLEEREPVLEPFDGAAVAREREYLAQDARHAAQEFATARAQLTGILSALTEEDLRRAARFEDRRITMADLVAMIVAHDEGHREEIERLLDQLED
jgi:hypothetical protein